ncbi:MAG TPA: hypothetical protein VE891_05215 [Allosphingosinicella sp.]|nr:hypothetical protein [Allosphingosinicella sp.]
MGRAITAWLLLGAAAAASAAPPVATSPGPRAVAVTVYRAPLRGAGQAMDLRWLNGFALVTETRRISIPAGESDVRFEGVAGGILPESAIVTGFPAGVAEKNQDAWLLSPASLLDSSLGRRVHLRRTSLATGAVRETEAVVRSGAQGAVVLETPDGIEALRCDGLRATLAYDGVPAGLSAKPTLSVRVRSPRAVSATVTLSYLASGFDWQADYVADLAPDGATMNLFAWLTLANGDETGFRQADTQAVAGRINRSSYSPSRPQAPPLVLRCWPSGTTTSDLEEKVFEREEIVVTSSRVMMEMMPPPPVLMEAPPPPPPPAMMAEQEELGDLKLYRIPERVTVAARSQKQVALLRRPSVKVDSIYRQRVNASNPPYSGKVMRVLVAENDSASGLGLPLPSGKVAVFGAAAGRRILFGSGTLEDKAVGERVEIVTGAASSVTSTFGNRLAAGGAGETEIVVANSNDVPIRYEAELDPGGMRLLPGAELPSRNGRPLWSVTVPANGEAIFRYRVEKP